MHGYGTAAGGLGLNAFMVRDLLGHKTLAMTGQYVQRDTDPLRALAGVRPPTTVSGTPPALNCRYPAAD
ncbi:MAG: hypothetical protein ACE5H8_11660 [Alphaproteobacteria bacterium]